MATKVQHRRSPPKDTVWTGEESGRVVAWSSSLGSIWGSEVGGHIPFISDRTGVSTLWPICKELRSRDGERKAAWFMLATGIAVKANPPVDLCAFPFLKHELHGPVRLM